MSPEDPRHGSEAGYTAHRRDKTKPCQPCADAASYARSRRHQRPPSDLHALTGGRWIPRGGILIWDGPRPADEDPTPRQPARCGTDSGYHHHIKRSKTPACEPCKAAHREANRSRAAA